MGQAKGKEMGQMDWKMPLLADDIQDVLTAFGFPPLLAGVLRARGADSPEKAARVLLRDETLLGDPWLLRDMDRAVARLRLAIENRQKLVVYGDYDVDGITSACLLYDYFQGLGLDCTVYIPDRLAEGYGLNKDAIDRLKSGGADLIVTVDCGVTAISEADYVKSLGMDIIITDHHECPQTLPDAAAVINPKRPDSDYPFTELAGVGVAFKLVCALEGDWAAPMARYVDLVAVGTIADVMPLVGENRTLASKGLEKLRENPLPGLAALLEEAGAGGKPLTAATVGFTLAPRINAAGRLCRTEAAVGLLISKSREEAQERARELCTLNRRRQELETAVWEDAAATLAAVEPTEPIVLESESWHPGVVGIAASKLTEAYKLPAVMICIDEGRGKGSCRSFGDFNLFEALSACSAHLESFGGHAFAAGLNIIPENIDAFRQAFAEYYHQNPPTARCALEPELLVCDPASLSLTGVEALSALEPCGCGNEAPLMCMTGALLESVTPIGGGKHLRLRVSKSGKVFDCVFFSHTAEALGVSEGETIDLCFTPQVNAFRAHRSVQLLLVDVRKSETQALCRDILSKKEIPAGALLPFRPGRKELACLWRALMRTGGRAELDCDGCPRGQALGFLEPVKLCLALRIFNELGLLELRHESDRVLCLACDGEKTELERSPMFRLLWAQEDAVPAG